MNEVKVLVLRAAGINCDEETMHCWRLAGASPELWHINALAKNPSMLDDFTIVTIPGGFAYGDDIAAGVILAQRVMHDLAEPLRRLVDRGGGILGICNGFQVLVKMGLLPGGDCGRDQVTVTYNDSAKFEARWVKLEVCTDRCPFLTESPRRAAGFSLRGPSEPRTVDKNKSRAAGETCPPRRSPRGAPEPRTTDKTKSRAAGFSLRGASAPGETDTPSTLGYLEMPVEHAEGKVVTANDAATKHLEENDLIAVRYVDDNGRHDTYPANPNGSTAGIAGLCDPTGRIFGLMPHPDRHFDHMHHPLWTRRNPTGPPDGLTIFQNAVAFWE